MKLSTILNHCDFDWKFRRQQPKVTEMFLAIVEKLTGQKPSSDNHSPLKKAANTFSMRAKKMNGGNELDFQAREKSWLESYEIDEGNQEGNQVMKEDATVIKDDVRVIKDDARVIKETTVLKEAPTVLKGDARLIMEGVSLIKKNTKLIKEDTMIEEDRMLIKEGNIVIKEDTNMMEGDDIVIEDGNKEIEEDNMVRGKKVEESDMDIGESDKEESRIQTLREKIALVQKMNLQYNVKRKRIMMMKEAKLKSNHNLQVRLVLRSIYFISS